MSSLSRRADAEPVSIPLDVRYEGGRIEIRLPLPHASSTPQATQLLLIASPADDKPYLRMEAAVMPPNEQARGRVQAAIDSTLQAASTKKASLADIVAIVDQALRV